MTAVRRAVARSLDEVEPVPSVVTVGFFDGVHRGHQTIIRRAVAAAEDAGVRATAVTFDRHPMEVLAPGSQPKMLMTLDRRIRTLVDEMRLDLVLVLPFTLALSRWPAERFVDEVLVGAVRARKVVVGSNFRFGHKAAGTVATLNDLGPPNDFAVETVGLLHEGERAISSTEVRRRLAAGEVEWAAHALGRPHALDGTVVRGDGRGRAIGVPTANVEAAHGLQVPGRGVYAGHLEVGTALLPAVVNVGVRPTFGEERFAVEAHVLDFDGDLYGEHVAVWFVHRLRDEQRFDGVDALVAQIRRDIERGRQLLSDDGATTEVGR